jgi:formylglycine-generating enzyme required for sulfatase activity
MIEEEKPEPIAAEPVKPAPPEPPEPRLAEPPQPKTSDQIRRSRARLVGGLAGLSLLLLMAGLWWFLPGRPPERISTLERQPEKRVSPVERQPVPTELKTITNSIGMKFVLIPAGTFQMGSPKAESGRDEDERQHQVTISQPFYMQTTEVTQGQWQKVMGNNPSYFKKCGQDCPVEQVSWEDAQEFIKKLNKMEKTDKYRLPTEAEWEYASRADSKERWSFGDDEAKLEEYAWYSKNSQDKTHPVGQRKPNAWGLYDMHGNVLEWCQDRYGDYPAGPVTDPTGSASGERRVLRGGSWDSDARYTRSANRDDVNPDYRHLDIGFRVARAL